MQKVDDWVWGSAVTLDIYSGMMVNSSPSKISETIPWVLKQADVYSLRAQKLSGIVVLLTAAKHEGVDGARRMQVHHERIWHRYRELARTMQIYLIICGAR